MTRLDRAVDREIARENRAFLADPKAIADAQADGEAYRRRLEAAFDLEVRLAAAVRGMSRADLFDMFGDEVGALLAEALDG